MRGMSLQPTGSLRGHWLRQIKENPTKAFGHCKGIVFYSESTNDHPNNNSNTNTEVKSISKDREICGIN